MFSAEIRTAKKYIKRSNSYFEYEDRLSQKNWNKYQRKMENRTDFG